MEDTRTGVHIFDTVGFCDMLEKALERESLVDYDEERRWELVAVAQKKEIERMRTMISGLYRVCNRVNEECSGAKVCSDDVRVSLTHEWDKGSIGWNEEFLSDQGWKHAINGGLNYSTQQGTFSVNT